MTRLFDENNEEEEDFNEESEDQEAPKFGRDKIFSNDYNTGNLDFEEYNLPKVESFYAESNLDDCYDSYEYHRKKVLEDRVDQYFKESEHGKILVTKKKLPKQVLPLVYVSIRERFIDNDYLGSEIFIGIAEYFGVNYEVLYENIPSIYREELVRELDDKYGMLKKKGVKRLF